MTIRTATVITVSDRVSRGDAEDRGGPLAAGILAGAGWQVRETVVVPDEVERIADAITQACEASVLVVTTGGTGLAARDVTPEAVRTVIEREVPGLAEAMRAVTIGRLPQGLLSRQVAGTRGGALVIALPGSTGGVRDGLEAVLDALPHAVDVMSGDPGH